ncbi:transcription initiation factor TFIID subunit 4-like [Heterocephalus glaber]|uniref:Transcription initiation factor TFIID subunit 4-like n=1 Tax=Heterocephalus glaber TaxID=10181 RepID=A0AAX6TJX1_HETGA|nr:transcription initiation factor TFIID subunit 4-like [Heterocephalus glaber]
MPTSAQRCAKASGRAGSGDVGRARPGPPDGPAVAVGSSANLGAAPRAVVADLPPSSRGRDPSRRRAPGHATPRYNRRGAAVGPAEVLGKAQDAPAGTVRDARSSAQPGRGSDCSQQLSHIRVSPALSCSGRGPAPQGRTGQTSGDGGNSPPFRWAVPTPAARACAPAPPASSLSESCRFSPRSGRQGCPCKSKKQMPQTGSVSSKALCDKPYPHNCKPFLYHLLLNTNWSHCVAQAGFEFMVILLPRPPECWDHRCVPPCLALTFLVATENGYNIQNLC